MTNFIENIQNLRVLVVGDVMLDRYWWGNVNRISPEAPVPVVNLERISVTAGGAANVAANIAGLGAEAILVGLVGEDEEANLMSEMLAAQNISTEFLLKSSERPTTVKTRIVAHNQQIVRVDRELKADLSFEEEEKILEIVFKLIDQVEAVVFSDYGKGLGTENFLKRLITKSDGSGKNIFIDPKGKSYKKYAGATMLTPNRFEMAEACNLETTEQSTIENYGRNLVSELNLKYLLITQGEDGMTLIENEANPIHLPVEMRNVYDVTGAGDTVIACLAAAFSSGASFIEAAKFANRAAGLVIERLGTTAITLEMLKQEN